MKIIDIIRLIRKHIVLLLVSPVILAGLVILLTQNPNFKYASETTLYTGIASGSSVEMDKSFNFFATNTAFDNLINVLKSRETQQEVAIRLFSQHLMLDKPDPQYISPKSYAELMRITPDCIRKLVVKKTNSAGQVKNLQYAYTKSDSGLARKDSFSFDKMNDTTNVNSVPASIDIAAYEQTVKNITDYALSNDTNFVYRLLNFDHPHYSIKAINAINAQRISNSDLVKVKYETDDPGVCQQTLEILTDVCIRNYKNIKENRSDAVVKYFEFQLNQASGRLRVAEDKLLEFNKANNIINYYEQSKAVAVVKEDLDVEYNNKRIKLAGVNASIKNLEEKLGNQRLIHLESSELIEKRNQLGDLTYQINSIETFGLKDNKADEKLTDLKMHAEKLKGEIKKSVSVLYSATNTIEGLPISTILNDWITNVIEAENLKAGLEVQADRIKEFQKQYAIYAPAGANIKRIEREISVSEQEFLEILHGLNLAKLKMQDNELSSNIKAVDPPFFPISPIPTKRKILVIVGALLGIMIVLGVILVLEYFDDSLLRPSKAVKRIKLLNIGVLPKIRMDAKRINLPFIVNRLLEMMIQKINLQTSVAEPVLATKTILVFSTLSQEGKSFVTENLARKYKIQGKKVLLLNFSHDSLFEIEASQTGYTDDPPVGIATHPERKQQKFSVLRFLLGYPDVRIDRESRFLESPDNFLEKDEMVTYKLDENYFSAQNYEDLLNANHVKLSFVPDVVLIEIPAILFYPYPSGIVANADLPVLVVRSNRVWTEADQGVLNVFVNLTKQKPQFILNGVEPLVVESLLGDLPRKRTWIRRALKNMFRFQFLTSNQI